jgi:hypothetical protein
VVDALLAKASDQVKYQVGVKLAGARAAFRQRYGEESPEILPVVRQVAAAQDGDDDQMPAECPVCQSRGFVTGGYDVEWAPGWDESEPGPRPGTVWFTGDRFACRVCTLRLGSTAELEAAGVQARWEIADADAYDYLPHFD